MGVIPGAEITLVKLAPMKDPMEFRIHGYELTLRVSDASHIEAQIIGKSEKTDTTVKKKAIEHPGLGEDGKYHDPKNENPLRRRPMMSLPPPAEAGMTSSIDCDG